MGSSSSSPKLADTATIPTEAERPEAVGQTRHRSGDQETSGQREHEYPCPQGGFGEAIAMGGQPDALKPDNEDEHEAASPQGGHKAGHVAGGEGTDLGTAKSGTSEP